VPARLFPPRRRASARSRRSAAGWLTGAVAATALLVCLAGCSQTDAALTRQVGAIQFRAGTPSEVREQIKADCSHIPHLKLRTVRPQKPGEMVGVAFTYWPTTAGVQRLTALYGCLQQFSVVTGVRLKDRRALPPST
jgi:hypothetical protein